MLTVASEAQRVGLQQLKFLPRGGQEARVVSPDAEMTHRFASIVNTTIFQFVAGV